MLQGSELWREYGRTLLTAIANIGISRSNPD